MGREMAKESKGNLIGPPIFPFYVLALNWNRCTGVLGEGWVMIEHLPSTQVKCARQAMDLVLSKCLLLIYGGCLGSKSSNTYLTFHYIVTILFEVRGRSVGRAAVISKI